MSWESEGASGRHREAKHLGNAQSARALGATSPLLGASGPLLGATSPLLGATSPLLGATGPRPGAGVGKCRFLVLLV